MGEEKKHNIGDEFDPEGFKAAIKSVVVPTTILFKEYKGQGLSTVDAALLASTTFAELMKGFEPPKRPDEDELEL